VKAVYSIASTKLGHINNVKEVERAKEEYRKKSLKR
jgi:hypothetical protein